MFYGRAAVRPCGHAAKAMATAMETVFMVNVSSRKTPMTDSAGLQFVLNGLIKEGPALDDIGEGVIGPSTSQARQAARAFLVTLTMHLTLTHVQLHKVRKASVFLVNTRGELSTPLATSDAFCPQ